MFNSSLNSFCSATPKRLGDTDEEHIQLHFRHALRLQKSLWKRHKRVAVSCLAVDIGNFEIVDFFRLGSSNKSFGCEAVLIFSKVIAGQSMTEVKWRHNHDLQSFASRSRRDPASFVKEWFVSEYGKGTPPMKALRVYIDELFEHSKLSSRQVVQVMSDR